jgi:Fe-S cluster assembly protein SufD
MPSATASNEAFMAPATQVAAALPWLAGAEVLGRDKAAGWVKALRATGAESFARTGFPAPSQEGWQYTNLRSLSTAKFTWSAEPVIFDAGKLPAPLLEGYRIVVVNGQYQAKLSSAPEGVSVVSLMEAADKKLPGLEDALVRVGDLEQSPLVALNSAYIRDGFVLSVAPGRDIEKPVEVLFYNTGNNAAIYPRVLYRVGENSGLTLVERHMGEGAYFTDAYIGIAQEQASRLRYYRFQDESVNAFHINVTALQQQKEAQFEGFSLAAGAKLARQEYQLQLLDKNICTNIGGIYVIKDEQSHDFTVLADHFEPRGKSAQHFRGVADDKARAVFQGKIHVRRAAQKTDGYQSHHALLLAPTAEASAKPELEIYADDVKCSHGATSGQLDPVALFYLRARGIPEDEAKALLAEAFIAGALEQVTHEALREIYRGRISTWLSERSR